MVTPNDGLDEGKLHEVQRKIDEAADRARDHGMVLETHVQQEEREDVEQHKGEEAIDGLTRPGMG